MINRINLILRAKNITARQFAEEIGIQPSGMSHIMGGRNNPSLEFVSKVLRRYPEIDANWLLLGKGEMYASPQGISKPAVDDAAPLRETNNNHQVEPSLFDEEPVEMPTEVAPVQNSIFQQDVIEEEERRDTPSYTTPAQEPQKGSECRVERILLIYSDNTYKELLPHDK